MNSALLFINKNKLIWSTVLLLSACGGGDSNLAGSNPAANTPTINLTLNTSTLFSGQQGTLSWSSTNATSCVASDAWSGSQVTNGSLNITAIGTGINTYTLSCTGPTGTNKQSINLTVNPPPLSFIAGKIGGKGNFDGIGAQARIGITNSIAIDTSGNTFIADTYNHTIRKVSADGVVTTFAGSTGKPGYADGPSTSAQFNSPSGITIDRSGNVFVADHENHVIRKISTAGIVTTFVGLAGQKGDSDGGGQAARFAYVADMTIDSQNNLYVIDDSGRKVRKISSSGEVTTLEPIGGLLASAPLSPCSKPIRNCVTRGYAFGIYVDNIDTVYVTDAVNPEIIWYDANGNYGTVSIDGATIKAPSQISGDTAGNLYVDDLYQRKIYKLRVYRAPDQRAASAEIWKDFSNIAPSEITYSIANFQDKYVMISNESSLKKVMPDGSQTTFIGSSLGLGSQDGVGDAARFNGANKVVADNHGNLYVSDTENHTIRKISIATGEVSTIAGKAGVAGTDDGMGPLARLGVNFLINNREEFETEKNASLKQQTFSIAANTRAAVSNLATTAMSGVTWSYAYMGGNLPLMTTAEVAKAIETNQHGADTYTWKKGVDTISDPQLIRGEFGKARAKKGVPYGALRSKVGSQTELVENSLTSLNQTGPVYVHSIDADAPDFSTLTEKDDEPEGWLKVLDAYDEMLDGSEDPDIIIGGYNLIADREEFKGDNAEEDYQHTVKSNVVDTAIRLAVFSIEPTMIYPTEPNFLIKASTYKEVDKASGKKNVWGNRAFEGRNLMDNYIRMQNKKKLTSKIAYNPLASVPTGVGGGGARLKITKDKKYDDDSIYGKPQGSTKASGDTIAVDEQYVVQAQSWAGASRLASAYLPASSHKKIQVKKEVVVPLFAPVEQMALALARGEDPASIKIDLASVIEFDSGIGKSMPIYPILEKIKSELSELHKNEDFASIAPKVE